MSTEVTEVTPEKIEVDPALVLWTPEHTAKVLDITTTTLAHKRWHGDTDLKYVKFGGGIRSKVMYRPADVQAYIDSCVVVGKPKRGRPRRAGVRKSGNATRRGSK